MPVGDGIEGKGLHPRSILAVNKETKKANEENESKFLHIKGVLAKIQFSVVEANGMTKIQNSWLGTWIEKLWSFHFFRKNKDGGTNGRLCSLPK